MKEKDNTNNECEEKWLFFTHSYIFLSHNFSAIDNPQVLLVPLPIPSQQPEVRSLATQCKHVLILLVTETLSSVRVHHHLVINHLVINHLATNHLVINHLATNHLATNHLATNHLAINHLAINHLAINHLALRQVLVHPVNQRSVLLTLLDE